MAEPTANDAAAVVGTGLSRIAAGQATLANSDVNAQQPAIAYDPVTKQAFYATAPVPVKRLFASPLELKGPYVRGSVRGIDFGWTTTHRALDYQVALDEPVLAMGDGAVVFAGYQSKKLGLVNVEFARSDAKGNILAQNGDVLAPTSDVGTGGIALFILHSGDFEGYRTEYYNLGSISVSATAPANVVVEGQTIGKTGGTGGPSGFSTKQPHLSLQISFTSGTISTLVAPTSIAPNAWPGHQDSTSGTGLSNSVVMAPSAAFGAQVAASFATNMLMSSDRGTSLQNQGTTDLKQSQARAATYVQQTANARLGTLYAATDAFKAQPNTSVTGPMVFDFERGVWLINGVDQGPL